MTIFAFGTGYCGITVGCVIYFLHRRIQNVYKHIIVTIIKLIIIKFSSDGES